MVSQRPFADVAQLFTKSDEAWARASREDVLEAFASHPRIGESKAKTEVSAASASWAKGEQRGMAGATKAARERIAELNAAYEARFGFVYIVCATGKTPEEMISIAEKRLANDPVAEFAIATEEQRKITRIRLQKVMAS
jgi:2-oxo-4-hydroxy-4-carboxy-5-ureidoimidazoline decarboxylase